MPKKTHIVVLQLCKQDSKDLTNESTGEEEMK